MLDQFNELILNNVSKYLSFREFGALSCASKRMFGFFGEKGKAQLAFLEKACNQFLLDLSLGKVSTVPQFIMDFPSTLLFKFNFLDESGRQFKNISLFNYMLWSSNHVLLQACLPYIKADKNVLRSLLGQYDAQMKNGVTYVLDGVDVREPKYQPDDLLTVMKNYLNNKQLDSVYLVEQVGGRQKLLPYPWLTKCYKIENHETNVTVDVLEFHAWGVVVKEMLGSRAAFRRKNNGGVMVLRNVNRDFIAPDIAHLEAQKRLIQQVMDDIENNLKAMANVNERRFGNK
ncbi:MAG TPA: hypothetical protein VFU82_04390 [Gammaproteobacteria bacterium]|nr:hypothetical protein [Gammaproteobacteria bacterium]